MPDCMHSNSWWHVFGHGNDVSLHSFCPLWKHLMSIFRKEAGAIHEEKKEMFGTLFLSWWNIKIRCFLLNTPLLLATPFLPTFVGGPLSWALSPKRWQGFIQVFPEVGEQPGRRRISSFALMTSLSNSIMFCRATKTVPQDDDGGFFRVLLDLSFNRPNHLQTMSSDDYRKRGM